tara:strand:+ start:856 stop:990 length:135 start_codon:yes stop_codon:yes gene_type:complete
VVVVVVVVVVLVDDATPATLARVGPSSKVTAAPDPLLATGVPLL